MSRLDSFIRRLEAQRACLDWAVAAARDVPGAAVELGLGNGRSYDHLRARLAGRREIYALDRQVAAHPDCVPDAAHLLLGDFAATLPELARRLGRSAAIVHADTGSGDEAASQAQARGLVPLIDSLLVSGAAIVSDQDMAPAVSCGWHRQELPEGVAPGRYFLWRKTP
jgi:hypothetical protein